MSVDPRSVAEIRLIVIVQVNLTDPDLVETIAASGNKPVAEVVSAEVVSNLESVPYVESVVARGLQNTRRNP